MVTPTPISPPPTATPTPVSTSPSPPYAEVWRSLSKVPSLEENRPEIASAITSLPWIADGIEETERGVIQEVVNIGTLYERASISELLNKSWIKDGLDETEATLMSLMRTIGESGQAEGERILRMPFLDTIEPADTNMLNILGWLASGNKRYFQTVVEKQWIADGLQEPEVAVLREIREFVRIGDEEALLILGMPFLDEVEDVDVITTKLLVGLAAGRVELFHQIVARPWVDNGLDMAEIELVQELQQLSDRNEAATVWVTKLRAGESPNLSIAHGIR